VKIQGQKRGEKTMLIDFYQLKSIEEGASSQGIKMEPPSSSPSTSISRGNTILPSFPNCPIEKERAYYANDS